MTVRSARGSLVDFDLLTIKAQLAATPMPGAVKARQELMQGAVQQEVQEATTEENTEVPAPEAPKTAPKRK